MVDKDMPVEIKGPKRHYGQDLDFAELHRRPAQDMVYHPLDVTVVVL